MKHRTIPRNIDPNLPHVLRVALGAKGEHLLRIPFPPRLLPILEAVDRSGLARRGKTPEKMSTAEKLSAWGVYGAMLGVCWAHPDWDLEATVSAYHGDYAEYGLAVLDELYDAGYSQADIEAGMATVTKRVTAAAVGVDWEEVERRRDFSKAPEVAAL